VWGRDLGQRSDTVDRSVREDEFIKKELSKRRVIILATGPGCKTGGEYARFERNTRYLVRQPRRLFELSPTEKATSDSDCNRPPSSHDVEASTANQIMDYTTNDGNWTPLMTNVRRSMARSVDDASATRPGGPPAMRRSDGTPAGRLDRPSVRSLLDGVPTSTFRGLAAPRSIGDGDGLPVSLSYSTAVSQHRDHQ